MKIDDLTKQEFFQKLKDPVIPKIWECVNALRDEFERQGWVMSVFHNVNGGKYKKGFWELTIKVPRFDVKAGTVFAAQQYAFQMASVVFDELRDRKQVQLTGFEHPTKEGSYVITVDRLQV